MNATETTETTELSELIEQLIPIAGRKYSVKTYPSANGMIAISDSTGAFFCRPEHAKQCLENILNNDTHCSSVCLNGVTNDRYIWNPTIES